MVRGTFSPARAWRPAVAARLARTLGHTHALPAAITTTKSKAVITRLLEIRTYRLKPGTLQDFHIAVHEKAVPMLKAKGIDVVAYGSSNHEEETYFLIRSFADRESLEREQAAFYNSNDWKSGPRSALVERIETYMNTLIVVSESAAASMRDLNQSTKQ